jgi:hypothetical protein
MKRDDEADAVERLTGLPCLERPKAEGLPVRQLHQIKGVLFVERFQSEADPFTEMEAGGLAWRRRVLSGLARAIVKAGHAGAGLTQVGKRLRIMARPTTQDVNVPPLTRKETCRQAIVAANGFAARGPAEVVDDKTDGTRPVTQVLQIWSKHCKASWMTSSVLK